MKKIYFIIIFLFAVNIFGQENQKIVPDNPVPCFHNYTGFAESSPVPDHYPYLKSDMPFDVLIGYIALDSACRYGNAIDYLDFIERQKQTDTIKYLQKFLYEMQDYNPFLLKAIEYINEPNLNLLPFQIISQLKDLFANFYLTTDKLRAALLLSDVIAQVKIISKSKKTDIYTDWAGEQIGLFAEVKDLIKGNNLPATSMSLPKDTLTKVFFNYCLDWTLGQMPGSGPLSRENSIRSKYGENMIVPEMEYIVFLRIVNFCQDSVNLYYKMSPLGWDSPVFTTYPIINGKVIDPKNDFGFGTGLTVDEFKTKIREKITKIKNLE